MNQDEPFKVKFHSPTYGNIIIIKFELIFIIRKF